jgi:hypothetical protein
MLTKMSALAMTQSRPFSVFSDFSVLSDIDTNPATSRVNATPGFKRHAEYGTGPDLAPGGAH